MHISSNSVVSTSLSKIRLIDVSENRAAVPAEEKQQLKQQQHQTMIFLFLLNLQYRRKEIYRIFLILDRIE